MELATLTQSQKQVLIAADIDHEGHAYCVLALYSGMFRHNDSHGWLRYNGRYWESEGARQALERATTNTLTMRRELFASVEEFAKAKQCARWRNSVVNTMAQMAKDTQIYTPIAEFDKSPNFINCANGVVDLTTGELEPHHSGQMYTYCLPVAYKPDAPEPTDWLEFLESSGMDEEMIAYLQMALGYTITGHTREEIMFYIFGPPRSGKGTFMETINELMGELSTGVDMSTFSSNRYGDTSNFDLAPLKNKRMITASESTRSGQLNPAVIKKITGGDEVYCSYKRRDHFSYRPKYKIWLTSNFQAAVDVEDDAAWGRLRVIEFPNSKLGQEDKGLKERLKSPAKLESIFRWMVQGAGLWYDTKEVGLTVPDSVQNATNEHRAALDSIEQFLTAECHVDTDTVDEFGRLFYFTVGAELYTAYKKWSEDEGYTPYGRKRFTMSLEKRGIMSDRRVTSGKLSRGYLGVLIGGGTSSKSVDEPIPL
jgi:putative DNA primase/helicase